MEKVKKLIEKKKQLVPYYQAVPEEPGCLRILSIKKF